MKNIIFSILFLSFGSSLSAQNSDGFDKFFLKFMFALRDYNLKELSEMAVFPMDLITKSDSLKVKKRVFLKSKGEFIFREEVQNLNKVLLSKTQPKLDEDKCVRIVSGYDKNGEADRWFIFCKYETGWKWTGQQWGYDVKLRL